MGKPRTYTDEQFINAVAQSVSWRQVLGHLGLKHGGGTYVYLKNLAEKLNLDLSHMTGSGWNKGENYVHPGKRPIEDYLSNEYPISTYRLKNRLWEEGLLEKICFICKITTWNNKPAPLQLDHIDGNRSNNNLSNLQILCPNCHAQTETYCGKNIGKNK